MKMTKTAVALAFTLALSGCGPLVSIGSDGKAPTLYTLTAPDLTDSQKSILPVSVLVTEPTSSDALDSRRIALMPSDLEVKYYEGLRWTDRAPRLIQSMLVTSLAGHVSDVATGVTPIRPTYRLTSRLTSFETRYNTPGRPVAHVTMELQLYSTSPAALIASTRVSHQEDAGQDRPNLISHAFNKAAQETVKAATLWSYDQMAQHQGQLAGQQQGLPQVQPVPITP